MDTDSAIGVLKKITKVSEVVVLRRARDLSYISQSEFMDRHHDCQSRKRDNTKESVGSPDFYTLHRQSLS